MKRAKGSLLLGVCSMLAMGGLLQGCESKQEAPPAGMSTPADAAAPVAQKFTIVGAGK
jgi:hypothetical protein